MHVAAKSIKIEYVVHEIRSGDNATIVTAAGVPGTFAWGTLLMNDNMVRATESVSSTLLGKSTGFGAVTTKAGVGGGILSVTKVLFGDASEYNASTITLTATFATAPPYDVIVLGGTGKLRGCSGYAVATPGLTTLPVYTTKFDMRLKC